MAGAWRSRLPVNPGDANPWPAPTNTTPIMGRQVCLLYIPRHHDIPHAMFIREPRLSFSHCYKSVFLHIVETMFVILREKVKRKNEPQGFLFYPVKMSVLHQIRNILIALWPSASKFTVCGRDEVEASNCEFWSASTQSDLVCSCGNENIKFNGTPQ